MDFRVYSRRTRCGASGISHRGQAGFGGLVTTFAQRAGDGWDLPRYGHIVQHLAKLIDYQNRERYGQLGVGSGALGIARLLDHCARSVGSNLERAVGDAADRGSGEYETSYCAGESRTGDHMRFSASDRRNKVTARWHFAERRRTIYKCREIHSTACAT